MGIAALVLIAMAALFIKPDQGLTLNCRTLLSAFTEACQQLRQA